MPRSPRARATRASLISTRRIAEYPVLTASSGPSGITTGPDGALWFTEVSGNNIGRITTGGTITEYPIPTANSEPCCIAAGPDGALWFLQTIYAGPTGDVGEIGRITTTGGTITEYPIPGMYSFGYGIANGPDGALWFTENGRLPDRPRGLALKFVVADAPVLAHRFDRRTACQDAGPSRGHALGDLAA